MQLPQINSVARLYALFLGGVLLVVGLLGVFGVNPLHNIAHILTGAIGVVAGLLISDRSARFYTAMMCVLYGALALLGFLQVAILQVFAFNLPDNLLHTAIFVLSLLVYLSAIFEQRTLDRLADHAQVAGPNQMGMQPNNYAAATVGGGQAEQLDFAQVVRNRWDNVRGTPAAQNGSNAPYNAGATDTVRALEEHVAYLEGQLRDLKQQVDRLLLLEWDVTQLKNGRSVVPGQTPAPQSLSPASQVPARPAGGVVSMPNRQTYQSDGPQQGGWPQPPYLPQNPHNHQNPQNTQNPIQT